MQLHPGARVAHYKIVAPLGAGGMGEVYRATDSRLGRDVALKVLPPEMARSPERLERFQREAKALAALDHPGIVTVYSVEDHDGVQFLTMQLVEGEPLDRVIPADGLPLERIFAIATALAEALAAAHDKGIVHRDLKPANVMVTKDGRVKVLDFGLARMTQQQPSGDSEMPTHLRTQEGVVMGTVPYMSPEQVSGRELDHRTDIFSLGIILYEMTSGRRPFQGNSSAELASAILRDPPPPLSELRANMPERLRRAIDRCMEKSPSHRFSTAHELRDALRASAGDSPSMETPGAPAAGLQTATDSGASRDGFWVAVLPFKYRGLSTELAALADGLSEEIVTGLSRFTYLHVVARGSTVRFTSEATDIRTVGKELGARYVMEGSLRQAGSLLRISVQLLDASTGGHLWAETYERTFSAESVFEIQDELVPPIVSTVADSNGILVRSMSEAVRSRDPEQLSPYEAVLRSFGYGQRVTPEELAAARAALEVAVRNAPAYADAWAMLAWLYLQDHAQGFNLQPDSLARGFSAAQRAVDAGPSNPLAWFSLAQALFFQKEFQSFRHAADRAAALNPMDGNSIAFLGELLTYAGDWERGMALAGRAKQLNPNYPGWYWYADFYNAYRQGDYRGALGFALKINLPGQWFSHAAMAAALGQLGEADAASKAVRDLLKLRPDFAATVSSVLEKWWEPEYRERMIEGWRKAGLEIPGGDASSKSARGREVQVSIAVLPFSDMSAAKDQEYLCEGMAEEIMNALVRIDGIRVASRTSAFRAGRDGGDLPSIARTLSVNHVLEGSVRTAGDRLRVTAQLTDVASGYQLWSERFDRVDADVFAIQDEIAAGVVDAVKTRLAPGIGTVHARPQAHNLEAYRSYLKGRHLRGKEDFFGARSAFEEAVRLDPAHAPSWTGLAEITVLSAHMGMILPRPACAAARKMLATATELQGESAEGLHVEAFAAYLERRWEAMETNWRRALELQPDHVLALGSFAISLCARRKTDEALLLFERARKTDPLASFPYTLSGWGLLMIGRPEEALHQLEDALTFEKEDASAIGALCIANVALGKFEQAIEAGERVVALTHRRAPFFLGVLGWALSAAGRDADARMILEELRARAPGSPTAVSEAWLLGALGEIDAAFDVLARAEDEYQGLVSYTGLPGFDSLRSDQRFAALLGRLGLLEESRP